MIYLVHGLNGSASNWNKFIDYFQNHSYQCEAIDLKKGFDLRKTHLVDYINKVIDQVSKDDILIGHSMGALIMQKVVEKTMVKAGIGLCPAPPADISLQSIAWWRQLRYLPFVTLGIPFKPSFGLVKSIFLTDMNEKKQKQIYKNLQKQSSHVTFEVMKQKISVDETKISVPLHFIARKNDKTISVSTVEQIADKYDASFDIVEGNHYIFYDWKKIAENILSFLQRIEEKE